MILDFFSQPVFQRLAVTLLHVLWQGAVVAVLLGVVLRGLRRHSTQLRYVLCGVAMTVLVIAPVVTFCLVPVQQTVVVQAAETKPSAADVVEHPQPNVNDVESPDVMAARFGEVEQPISQSNNGVSLIPTEPNDAQGYQAVIAASAPYVVLAWMVGVLFFGLRLLGGFLGVRSLLRSRLSPTPQLQRITRQLSRAMRMASTPLIACSERIGEAMVVGFFRPVVMLPLAWLTQLSPEVLRSVIAHELAHVRRWDRWVNLLQRVVEVVLFYHPAVWWVSQRMRTEREFRCDEMAAEAVGDPLCYAEALEHVGRMRVELHSLILATSIGGTKMALLKRVRNVLGVSRSPQKRGGLSAGVLAVCLPAVLCLTAVWWQTVQADNTAVTQEGERKEVEREVRERGEGERREIERRERGRREEGERREGRERERREEGERREGREGRERGPREGRPDARPPRGREGGDRPREGRPDGPPRGRDGDRPRGERPGPGGELRELMAIIRELRAEVSRLRRDVNELKGRGPRGRDGDGPRPPRGEGDRPRPPRGEGDRPRPPRGREGDRPRERETDRPRGERDRPRGEGDRRRETDRPRREIDRPRGENERPRGEGERRPEREKEETREEPGKP